MAERSTDLEGAPNIRGARAKADRMTALALDRINRGMIDMIAFLPDILTDVTVGATVKALGMPKEPSFSSDVPSLQRRLTSIGEEFGMLLPPGAADVQTKPEALAATIGPEALSALFPVGKITKGNKYLRALNLHPADTPYPFHAPMRRVVFRNRETGEEVRADVKRMKQFFPDKKIREVMQSLGVNIKTGAKQRVRTERTLSHKLSSKAGPDDIDMDGTRPNAPWEGLVELEGGERVPIMELEDAVDAAIVNMLEGAARRPLTTNYELPIFRTKGPNPGGQVGRPMDEGAAESILTSRSKRTLEGVDPKQLGKVTKVRGANAINTVEQAVIERAKLLKSFSDTSPAQREQVRRSFLRPQGKILIPIPDSDDLEMVSVREVQRAAEALTADDLADLQKRLGRSLTDGEKEFLGIYGLF